VSDYPQHYDELYVVSDIHMGGKPGAQIFNRGRRLAAFIDQVAAERPDGDIALVLNGDIVDSLAEPGVTGYVALDGDTAVAMMARIAQDPAFAPVWDSLAAFVKRDRRHLVLIVGNHDIELALPVVEAWVRRRLAGGDGGAQSRLTFATHGGGFACRVGAARVFCTHGNEVDEWNHVDYTLLAQLANAINAGRAVDPARWKPNAGTRLVRDVMNIVKARFPFVDLLKPETAAVAGVLMAIDKDTFNRIDLTDAFPVLRDKVKGRLVVRRLLGPEATSFEGIPPHDLADAVAAELLGPSLREAVLASRGNAGRSSEDSLLLDAGCLVVEGKRASDTLAAANTVETLGRRWDLFAGWVGLVDKEEGLRRALVDWLSKDTTYVPASTEDDTYARIKDRVGGGVDVVITGHTHLARALPLGGGRWYFNCGTWIRLLKLTREALDERVFAPRVWDAITKPLVADLDSIAIPGPDNQDVPLVFDRTNAVHVSSQGNTVTAELLRVTGVEDGTPLRRPLEPGTKREEIRR
jgi:UDP-2,3-diacylglucosamine pyrophosphatase LpxH